MTLLQSSPTFVITIVLFILIIISYLVGQRVRKMTVRRNPEHSQTNLKAISGTLLGLLGLLLAFTFGMSNSRFSQRKDLIIEEANAIGTATLRTEVYPDSVRKLLRANLKEYVNIRIAFYEAGMDMQQVQSLYRQGEKVAAETWSIAARYAQQDDITTRTSQLIPALNAMIDIASTRRAAGEGTIPDSIMYFLFILCCCSSFLLGYENPKKIDWIVVVSYAVMLSATVFTIIDLDRPRSGLIDMAKPNQHIIELRMMFAAD